MAIFLHARSCWKFLLVSLLSVVIALPSVNIADAGNEDRYRFNRPERCLMVNINRIRARHGLPRLERDKQMGYVAREHARTMAGARAMWHDPDVEREVTRWRRLAQNTGRGPGCRRLGRSFMRSPTHRNQILGRFRYFAVGVQRRGGTIYVQELFESRRNPGNTYHYP